MPDLRLTAGSPGLAMRDGTIARVTGGRVWWADTAGRVTGPARLAWLPPPLLAGGEPAHTHKVEPILPGTACVVLIPQGDFDRAIVIPLQGEG